jgi:hypothetical protein
MYLHRSSQNISSCEKYVVRYYTPMYIGMYVGWLWVKYSACFNNAHKCEKYCTYIDGTLDGCICIVPMTTSLHVKQSKICTRERGLFSKL